MIPSAAVEAAAKAEYEHEFLALEGRWEDATPEARALFRQSAKVALEAAAPYMLAGAWEEGRDAEFQRSVMKRQVDPNPYMRDTEGEK